MPIQVMLDDSGGENQVVFCFSGLIGEADDWISFSEQWANALREPPSIRYFKMREAAKFSDEFHGFTREQRDEKVRRLAKIINGFGFTAIDVMIEADDFVDIVKRVMPKPLGYLYFWAYHISVMACCDEMLGRGQTTERFEMFFDKHLQLGQKVKAWYPLVYKLSPPENQAIMPIEPQFRDDKEFVALQAADLFAWFAHRGMSGEEHSFEWLQDELANIPLSKECQYVDAERMRYWLNLSDEHLNSGTITPEDVAETRRIVGLD